MAMAAESMTEEGGPRRAMRLLAGAYLSVFLLLAGAGIAITFLGDPHAGEATAGLDLSPPPPPPAKAQPKPPVTAATQDDITEQSDQGPLPRISPDGKTPMAVYGGEPPAGENPRIAIVISGFGISAKATEKALDMLPAGTTLAFAPYAGDVQHWVQEARRRGHEVLVEVPMEPYDFPDSDPGQYTLRAGADEDANIQRLNWALSRFTGYAGATNLLGGRFLSDSDSLTPVLSALAKRGLLFFDNGSVQQSAAGAAAAKSGIYFSRADDVIDSIQSAMEIDHRLANLESTAQTSGHAVGAGFLYPVTIERVAAWSKALGSKGIALAPLTAVASQPK
jgi:uncharacterized protein